MKSSRNRNWIGIGLLMGGLIMALAVYAQSVPQSFPQDNGPYKLDVKGYPKQLQKDYKIFSRKCGVCHSLARPLNTCMSPTQWKHYVDKMRHKPGSMIDKKQAEAIKAFLVYDQVHRKDKNPKKFFPALKVK